MYIALKSFKVQNEAGETRIVKPGDEIPEALSWRNAKSYVDRDWMHWDDGSAPPVRVPQRVRHAPPASVEIEKPSPASAPASAPAHEDATDDATDDAPDDGDQYSEKELNAMLKAELQEIAEVMEIDPDQNKAELVAHILAVQE